MIDKERLKFSMYSLIWIVIYLSIDILNTYTSRIIQSPMYYILSIFITTYVCTGPLLFSIQYLVNKYKNDKKIILEDFIVPFKLYYTDRYWDVYNSKKYTILTYSLIGSLFLIIEILLVIFDPEININHLFFDMIKSNHFCINTLEFILLSLASYIGVSYFIINNINKITNCEAILCSDTSLETTNYIINKMNKRYRKERIITFLKKCIPFVLTFSLGYSIGIVFGLYNNLCIYTTTTISISFGILISYPFIYDVIKAKINLFHKHQKEFLRIVELYNKYYVNNENEMN